MSWEPLATPNRDADSTPTACHNKAWGRASAPQVTVTTKPPTPTGLNKTARPIHLRGGEASKAVWQHKGNRRFTSFAVTAEALLATGHPDGNEADALLVSMNTSDGSDNWVKTLPDHSQS